MNQNNEIFDILIKHIIKIIDSNNNEVQYNTLEIKYEKRKYSSTYSRILYIDNVPLTRQEMRTFKVIFKCRCNRNNTILLCKYIVKNKIICTHCLQDRSFDDCVITNNFGKNKGLKTVKKYKKQILFDDCSSDFKEQYKKLHFSEDEFFYYIKYIYQINDVVITNNIINNIKYYYSEPTNNQMLFTSKISFDNGITKETIKNVKLKCSICGKIYSIHLTNIKTKNLDNLKCQTCSFTNYRYKIKKYYNITYQSNLEKEFVNKCIDNNIRIENGLNITYHFNNKKHTYITDFYLPDYKYIIEIKADNIWYKKDVLTGKFQAKVDAATKYCITNGLKYFVLFNQDIDDFITNIERDSLEN